MAVVWIPASLQSLTEGKSKVSIEGGSVREVVNNLEKEYPGIKDRLLDGSGVQFREGMNVYVDGAELGGNLLEPVEENSEIHFLPAISGG